MKHSKSNLKQPAANSHVSIGQAAKHLSVSIDTVRRWERAGRLSAYRLDGKNRYFLLSELDRFIQAQPLTTAEMATMLGVSQSTVRRLESEGKLLPGRDRNGKRQYQAGAVSNYLASKTAYQALPQAIVETTVTAVPAPHMYKIYNNIMNRVHRSNASKNLGPALWGAAIGLGVVALLVVSWQLSTKKAASSLSVTQTPSHVLGARSSQAINTDKVSALVLPSTFFVSLPGYGLSVNVPNQAVDGAPSATDIFATRPITADQIAGGSITYDNLSPDVQALISAGASKTDNQPADTIINQFSTNVYQTNATTVLAGLGLSGTTTNNVLTLGVNTGSTLAIVNNNLEVQLGSGSGLEQTAQGLQLLGSCASGQVLQWTGSTWACSAIASGSSVAITEGGVTITSAASAINFAGSDFIVVDNTGQANVAIDYANSGLTRAGAAQAITGNWSFQDSGFTIADDVDSTKQAAFQVGGISSGTTRTLAVPDASGTLVTTGNLAAITAVGTIASGIWQGSAVGVQFGGTGAASFTNGGILYGGGAGALQASAAGSSGQLLIANGSGQPTFATLSADATLSALGALTLASTGTATGTFGDSTHVPAINVDSKGRITSVTSNLITGAAPTGAASGDLTGNYPGPTVGKLQGNTLTISSLSSGQILQYNGTAFVNQTLSGDISLNSSGVTTIGAGKVTNANLINSSLSVSAGTGLSGGGAVALGAVTSLSVSYGSAAGTAVQGNTSLVCPSGSGNLSGGGTTITLGAGGTCAALSTVNNPAFTTSVTTPLVTQAGNLTISATGGGSNLTLNSAGQIILSGFNCSAFDNGGALTTNASGVLGCSNDDGEAAGSITGAGIIGRLPVFDGAGSLSSSTLIQNGSGLELDTGNGLSLLGGDLSVTGNLTVTGTTTLSSLGAGLLQSDSSGVLSSGAVDRNSGSLFSNQLSVGNGGTGATSFTTNGLVYGNGSGALQVTAAGTGGQVVVANASGVPTFVALSGDITINNSGVATIGAGKVSNGKLVNSSVTVTAGTGLSGGGLVALGGSTALNVAYGLAAGTAVEGNTTLTCASGSGNLSGGGTIITLGSGGTCGNLSISNAPTFAMSVTTPSLQSTGALSLASTGASNDVSISSGSGTINLAGTTVATANSLNYDLANVSNTTLTLQNSGGGVANLNLNGGSLQTAGVTRLTNAGVLQNITGITSSGAVTLSGLNSAGIVHTNSSGLLSTSAVALGADTSGSYVATLGSLTGLSTTGNSGAGSAPTLSVTYGSGANTAVQGNTTLTCPSGSGNLTGGGTSITLGTGGTCGALTTVNNPSFSGLITGSAGTTGLALTGAPTNSATSSLAQFGGAIASGNVATNGGTYLGLNAPSSGAGSAADFLNFQLNGTSKLLVTNAGAITATGQLSAVGVNAGNGSVQGTGGLAVTGNSTIAGILSSLTGLTSSGSITFSGLNSAGIVHNSAAGLLSTSAIALGTDTTGSYVANLGSLTGLSTTGNSGAGSTPTLSVTYGSSANQAVQGNTTLTCASGSGNLGGGGNTITLGTGGTCSSITMINNPSFSGLITGSAGTTGLALTGTPTNSATSSLVQIGSAIASGNAAANGGTYLGLNAPNAGAGSAADFVNFQVNGVSALKIDNTGLVNTSGGVAVAGTTVLTSGRALQNLTGLTVASGGANVTGGLTAGGTITFGGLNSVGILHTNASGVVSTSAIALGTDTSGSYITNLGALTGLTTTGNSGAGSTPTLSVTYGSSASQAVQGNTTLTCETGSGNLSGGGNAITLGSGGTCTGLTMINNPTFSGLITGSSNTTGLALIGTPAASATSSLVQVGSAIAGGNAVANGGTYLGLNAPNAGAGSAADFLNFQLNGVSKLQVTNAGAVTATGQLTAVGVNAGSGSVQGTGGLAITGNSTINGSLGSVTSLTSSGAIQGTAITGTTSVISNGGIFTGAGAGTQRIDVSGNLVGIGNFTSTGASTFATTGATGFTFKPGTDNGNAFLIQNAAGTTTLLDVDTSASMLTIAGTAATFATLTLTNSHVKSTQTTAPTIGTPTACGTTPTATVTAGSTDAAGSFFINSGTAAGGICTTVITFNKAYGAAPKAVILSPNYSLGGTNPAASVVGAVSAKSTTTVTVRLGSTGVVSTRYGFDYWVIE